MIPRRRDDTSIIRFRPPASRCSEGMGLREGNEEG